MADSELGIQLKHLEARLRHTLSSDVPRIAGKVAVDFFKQSFLQEGFMDTGLQRWPEVKRRQDPRVRGARATRRILTGDTGDLGESLTYRIRTPSEVVVKAEAYSKNGFNYAPVHNSGATDAGRHRNVVIPKRQFMGPSKTLDNLIMEEIDRKVRSVLGC